MRSAIGSCTKPHCMWLAIRKIRNALKFSWTAKRDSTWLPRRQGRHHFISQRRLEMCWACSAAVVRAGNLAGRISRPPGGSSNSGRSTALCTYFRADKRINHQTNKTKPPDFPRAPLVGVRARLLPGQGPVRGHGRLPRGGELSRPRQHNSRWASPVKGRPSTISTYERDSDGHWGPGSGRTAP